jgi:hypothetical protein
MNAKKRSTNEQKRPTTIGIPNDYRRGAEVCQCKVGLFCSLVGLFCLYMRSLLLGSGMLLFEVCLATPTSEDYYERYR